MKKCPNCGTILDDSKKSCYMCGASLDSSNNLDFGAAIDAAVGSKVTNEVDNVFNNGEDIKIKSSDVVAPDSDAFFGKNNDAFGVFGENISSLNNMKPSDPIEIARLENQKLEEQRILDEQAKKQAQEAERMKNEVEKKRLADEQAAIKEAEVRERQRLREESAQRKKAEREAQRQANLDKPSLFGIAKEDDGSQVIVSNVPKDRVQPDINWGDNLKDNGRIKSNKTITISKSMIFNSACIVVFIIMLVFVYFKFLKEAPDSTLELGSLKYKISDEFHLASSDSNSRYYTYGESCNLRLTYGKPDSNVDFIDNYFNTQMNNFISDDKYHSINESMVINDNTWDVLKIVEYAENPSSSSGVAEVTKYRYVAIVYNNKYYTTVFVNLNNDSTCSAMYNNFVDSLEF